MSQFYNMLLVGLWLLLPMVPAIGIFWLLSTRQQRLQGRVKEGVTKGVVTIPVINFKMSFEAFGSTATYLVLLAFSGAMFLHVNKEDRLQRPRAWMVEVPIYVVDPQGKEREAWEPIYDQITATLTPFQRTANNRMTFWVAKQDGSFPQVNLSIAGSPRASVDLNDPKVASEVNGRIVVSARKVIRLMPTEPQR